MLNTGTTEPFLPAYIPKYVLMFHNTDAPLWLSCPRRPDG